MICAILLKCSLFLYIAGAIPLTNDEINAARLMENPNLQINPSFFRSIDPSRQENPLAHKIFNVPLSTNVQSNYRGGENTQNYAPNRFVEPDLHNKELEPNTGNHEFNTFQTVYSQVPYQNSWRLPQQQDTNFYRQQGINGQTYNSEYTQKTLESPSSLSQLYQGSSHLQKILADPNIVRNIFSARQQTKQYTVVYPNGTIGYEDDLQSIALRHPNYVVVNYNDLEKLSNIKSENVFSTSTDSQQNMRNYVSSYTPEIPNIGNPSSFPLTHFVSNLPIAELGSQNNKNPKDSLEKNYESFTELPELHLENDSQTDNTKLDTKTQAIDNLTSTNTFTLNTEQSINGSNGTGVQNTSTDIPDSRNRNDILGKDETNQKHFEELYEHLENVVVNNNFTITNTDATSIEQNTNARKDTDVQNIPIYMPDNSKSNNNLHNNRKPHEPFTQLSEHLGNNPKKERTKPDTETEIIDKSVINEGTNSANKNDANDIDVPHTSTNFPEDINTNIRLNNDREEKAQEPVTGLPKYLENQYQKEDTKSEIIDKNAINANTNSTNMVQKINVINVTDIQHAATNTLDKTDDNLHKNEVKKNTTNEDASQSFSDANNNENAKVIYGNEVDENGTYTFTDDEFSNNDYSNDNSLEENEAKNWEYDDIENDKITSSQDDQCANFKTSDKQSVIWWKPDENEIKKLLNNATFLFYAPAETTHKDTKTVIYPNGTIVEIYTETTRSSDGGPTVTITKTTTYNGGSDSSDDNNSNNE